MVIDKTFGIEDKKELSPIEEQFAMEYCSMH